MSTQTLRTHPIVIIAGIAVTIFALVGTAAIMGWLPKAHTEESEAQAKIAAEHPADKSKHEKTSHMKTASAENTHNDAKACANCGVVQSVNLVEVEGKGSGLGMVAGGVVGGLLGNQIGQGNGRTVATVAGAAGGAYAGNKVEKNINKTKHYNIVVKMHDGTTRTFRQNTDPGLDVGEKVKIENGAIVREES